MRIDNTSLKHFILNNYSQVELFSKYMGVVEGDILNCIHNNKRVINPMRMEETASLTFNYYQGKLRMHDYGSILYRGDIFDLVGIIINENSYNRNGFINICKHIINDSDTSNIGLTPTIKYAKKEKTLIEFTYRNFTDFDTRFWLVGIHMDLSLLAKENVYAVENATIYTHKNGMYTASYYNHSSKDPCYAYFFDVIEKENLIKLYFPLRDKTRTRFITNSKYNFEGINRLYKTDYLVITKSYKDRLILRTYLPSNYCVTNFTSEAIRLPEEQGLAFKTTYKAIFINTDMDSQGICNAYWHYFKYKFIPIFIENKTPNIADSHVEGLLKLMNGKYHTYTLDDIKQRLSFFIAEHSGEYRYKDFYDLANIISSNELRDYITTKFKIL